MCSIKPKPLPFWSTHLKFNLENVTITFAPLLKVYYWESLAVDSLNDKLNSEQNMLQHSLYIPTNQINSKPLKMVFWWRNNSNEKIELRLKRLKNCDCKQVQTRVGFNQFRQLYHCPHRRLINIMQEYMQMKPNELIAMTITTYFYIFGEHKLSFEISCSDARVINLDFFVDIVGFDPQKCVLTKELIPTNVKDIRRFVQPIWVRNITMQHMNVVFSSRERGIKLINSTLTVPRQSVWPLMLEYRPSDEENELHFQMSFDCMRAQFTIKAKGVADTQIPDTEFPIKDYECVDFLYVLYPNKLEFDVKQDEKRSLIVVLHNYNQKCREFRWQNYVINDLFDITFEPQIFRLKPHHSKLCVVNLHAHCRPVHFKRIPAVLEVHRIFDKSTKIAKELLDEIESIDDPKWKQDSYMEHVFLHINIRVSLKKPKSVPFPWESITLRTKKDGVMPVAKIQQTTIFEKLFWEFLSKSDHMRETKDPPRGDESSYEEVIKTFQRPSTDFSSKDAFAIDKNNILKMISQLLTEGLREISKNWRFVPRENVEAEN